MAGPKNRQIAAVENYFADIRRLRATGGATKELSYYPPLTDLLNAIGATLRPKVFCLQQLTNQGAGHPDIALYTARQVQNGRQRPGQVPERGVVEVKGVDEDSLLMAASEQVSRYWGRYRLVLVTNLREFSIVGESGADSPARLETYRLARSEGEFWQKAETPRVFAQEVGTAFVEFLARVLSHKAALTDPKDLAWLLASYARDGLARVKAAENLPSLVTVRSALEEALGVQFEGEDGEHLFRSTLVQTLFYGVFSAWVLWSRADKRVDGPLFDGLYCPDDFNWREAVWHLRAPVLRALFQQLSDPNRLEPLGLVELLDWTSAALDRVDQTSFFAQFNEGDAVPYFYEPFLAAFDPALRKQLGVWYTPTDVVRYMVARVDKALKDDLGIAKGLAAENVYILDPCCGTGAYLAEVLRRIAHNLEEQGLGALAGAVIGKAATERVFGFEIMPAPFVVAHLQVGLTMQNLGAPLTEDGLGRPGVFLTNALTGWEPHTTKPLPFPELEEERDRAKAVKQNRPILVILGNPPYNGFAGMAVAEERELSEAYRATNRVRKPEGRGLNDPYVRFFRMAERRITDKTGQGVVCFISNYSWLDGQSFTGMRERYLGAFDEIRIDCLNGDKYKTGKVAPDGSPDPSIFSTQGDPVGIQVGTAIATLVRKRVHQPTESVLFRHLWGPTKRAELTATAEAEPDSLYSEFAPILELGLPFAETAVSPEWFDWPALPDLFHVYFPGVKTSRDRFLVDTDLDRLRARVGEYFDARLAHAEIEQRYPSVMKSTAQFDARAVRETLMGRGGPDESGFIRFAYRPFDTRWLYWERDTELIDRERPEYRPHVFAGNVWLSAAPHLRKGVGEPQACLTGDMGSLHLIERGAQMFPAWLRDDGLTGVTGTQRRANLTRLAQTYLARLGLNVEDLFYHVLATLHEPTYRSANAAALQMEWPRIPLPGWPDGDSRHAEALTRSVDHGRRLASLLDSEIPVVGVTQPPIRPEFASIAVPSTEKERQMAGEDFAVTGGWGHFGTGDAVMPGGGRIVERAYRTGERTAIAEHIDVFGRMTFDVYLNENAFWRNVPAAVWDFRLGGYQVLKKWLSYRERKIMCRNLEASEVQQFTQIARRIGAILLSLCPGSRN